MDDKELKYSHVLYKLRKMTPVLNDEEQLTDKIMRRIEQTISNAESHHAASGKNRVMRIAGILSGVAASALICLFAYDSLKYPVLPIEIFTKVDKAELYNNMLYERNNGGKAEIIECKLKSRKSQRVRNERLVSVFVNRMKSQ